MNWSILNKDGLVIANTKSVEYNGELLGDRYISTTIESPYPIDLVPGCTISYRDEVFTLYDTIGIKKQARTNEYGKAYIYSGVKFYSPLEELKHCLFMDVTYTNESTSTINGSLNSSFSFHATNVCDLASRILANLNRYDTLKGVEPSWQIKVLINDEYPYYADADKLYLNVVGKTNVIVDINDISVYDALKLVYDTFGCMWVLDKGSKTIRICSQGNSIEHTFTFGRGNGLRSIEKIPDTDNKIITVLHAYGSDKNMPNHYYYNKSKKVLSADEWFAKVSIKSAIITILKDGNLVIAFKMPKGITCKVGADGYAECYLRDIKSKLGFEKIDIYDSYFVIDENITEEEYERLGLEVAMSLNGSELNMPISIPNEYVESCYDSMKVYALPGNPSLLPITNLMLPSFSEENMNPVICNEEAIAKFGIIEGIVRFDNENNDEEIEEIYPTIHNEENKVGNGSYVEDDGIFDTNTNVPNFTIQLNRSLGFDLNDTRPDGQDKYGTLCMLDGMCGGREFDILKYDASTFTLTLKRTEDTALNVWFPTCDFPIKTGDSFVITDIEMPDSYIETASRKLEEKAKEYLAKHSQPKYTYNVDVDNVFMARQDSVATKYESYHYNIKEGDLIDLGEDADIGHKQEPIAIDKLTIKEGNNSDCIPNYSITLRKEKKKRTFSKLWKGISDASKSADNAKRIANSKSDVTMDDVFNTTLAAMKLKNNE